MSAKELRVECPRCAARLDVDGRTERVIRWRAPGQAEGGGKPAPGEQDWQRALERANGRAGLSAERFEQALEKERRREADLEALFARARGKGAAPAGDSPAEADPVPGSLWSLESAALASLADRWAALGVPSREFGNFRGWSGAAGWCWRLARPLPATGSASKLPREGHPPGEEAPPAPEAGGRLALPVELGGEVLLSRLQASGWLLAGFEAVLQLELGLEPPGAQAPGRPVPPEELASWGQVWLGEALRPEAGLGAWRPLWLGEGAARRPAGLWLRGQLAVLGDPGPLDPAGVETARLAAAGQGSVRLIAETRDPGTEPGRLERLGWRVAYHRALFTAPGTR
jgi:hypothetical protein